MKNRYIKFQDLTKNQKIFRIVNLVIMSAIFLACVFLLFWYGLVSDPHGRFWGTVVILVVCLFPLLFELIFRMRLNLVIFLIIEIYIAVAGLFGSALNGYGLLPWFDSPVHVLMGYVLCLAGMFVLARLGNYKSFSPWLVAVFCVAFSLGIEVLWELSEWIIDRLLGQTMQGAPLEGYGIPLLWDTIKDMFCNFGGTMIFFLHYIIGKKTKCHLGINAIETELTTRKLVKNDEGAESKTEIEINDDNKKDA